MALSVSGFPETSPDSGKLINRFFGANRLSDDTRPLPILPSPSSPPYQPVLIHNPAPLAITNPRPLPQIPPSSSTPSPSSSPTRRPIRSTLPARNMAYKRPRTTSQGFVSGSTTPTTSTSIPISWASRPVDLNAQRPGAGSSAANSGYKSPSTCPRVVPTRHVSSTSTPISASTPTTSSVFTSSGSTFTSTPLSTPASFTSPPLTSSPQHCLPRRSHSNTRSGIRRQTSFDGAQNSNTKTRMMTPPLQSSPVPLGLSFARLASVSSPQNRSTQLPTRAQQSQSAGRIGSREVGDAVRGNDVGPAVNANNNNRPTFRPLPYKSPIPDPEPYPSPQTLDSINTTQIPPPPPKLPVTTSISTTIGGVITKPTLIGPRSIGAKQKLQLSLQIPAIPMLAPSEQHGAENRGRKPQLPALKLVTDTILHPASTASSPSIKLSPSPSSPSALSYVSYSLPQSPVSPPAKQFLVASSSSPVQLSPTHSSLFSADSRIHLHPLSLSSPISGTASGSSARTSIGGWVIGGTSGGGGGGISPGGRSVKSLGGRSVNSLGGRRPRSVRSTRSVRSNRSRRSTNRIKIHHHISVSPPSANSVTTPTPMFSTNLYTPINIPGDHVGEYVGGGGDGEGGWDGVGDGEGDEYGYGYVEDGWGGGRSPSPIRYARPDSRGNLSSSDTENGRDGDSKPVGVYEGNQGTGDDSAASSEVEFADVDGDSDEDYGYERRVRRRRRSRKWRVDRTRGGTETTTDNTPSMTTSSPSLSLSIPRYALTQAPVSSHHSSHSSTHSIPSGSSPLSSSSSTKSYSNPYSTRKDRKRARKLQLRSFRHSYRVMPPIVPLEEEERGRGRGEEKKGGDLSRRGRSDRDRASSPVVMISMIPFRRKTPPPPPSGAEEQVALDTASASTKKKKTKSKDKDKEKVKEGKKEKPIPQSVAVVAAPAASKKKSTKSAIDLFNSMSASMSGTHSHSASLQSNSQASVLSHRHPLSPPHSYPQSRSESGSPFNTRPSSPERGRKSIGNSVATNKTRKKFAEAVSLALEEVTSRGRSAATAGGGGVSQTPFQPPGKTKPVTAYSSASSQLAVPFDEMEVLDISRLRSDDDGGVEGGGVDSQEEDVDVSVGVWVGEPRMERGVNQNTTLRKIGDGGGGVGTMNSSLLKSNPSVYPDDTLASTITRIPPLMSSIPRRPSVHQKQRPKMDSCPPPRRRVSSLGRPGSGATIGNNYNSNSINGGGNRRTQLNPYNRNHNNRNNNPFQLQPAYTAGISCGLPVSRPQQHSAHPVVRRPPLPPTPSFAAPFRGYVTDSGVAGRPGGGGGGEVAVASRPVSPLFKASRSVTRPAPPFSAPVVFESDSKKTVWDKGNWAGGAEKERELVFD